MPNELHTMLTATSGFLPSQECRAQKIGNYEMELVQDMRCESEADSSYSKEGSRDANLSFFQAFAEWHFAAKILGLFVGLNHLTKSPGMPPVST